MSSWWGTIASWVGGSSKCWWWWLVEVVNFVLLLAKSVSILGTISTNDITFILFLLQKAQVVLLLSLFSCKILERILVKAIGCPSQKHYIVSRCQKKTISIKSTSNKRQTICFTRYQMFEDQTSGNPQRLFDFLSHPSTTFRFGCSCSNSPPRPRET